jgi:hypothetical protein
VSVRGALNRHIGEHPAPHRRPNLEESHMASFMLLLHRSTTSRRPTDDVAGITREYMDWADRARAQGQLKGAAKLTDDAGRVMRASASDARVTTTDGPYAESKEIVGGYFLVAAADYAEACRIAADCPHLKYGSHIEVRQVQEL